MIKAATIPLILCVLLGASAYSQNNQSPAQAAEEEAVRRQASIFQLKKILEQAREAQRNGDLARSSQLYEQAYELTSRVGVGIEQLGAVVQRRPERAREAFATA